MSERKARLPGYSPAERPLPVLENLGLPAQLWQAISDCRVEADARVGESVSVIGPEWEGALIKDWPPKDPRGKVAIACRGIATCIGWGTPREHPDACRSFSITVAPTPPAATRQMSVSGKGGCNAYTDTLSDCGAQGNRLMIGRDLDLAVGGLVGQLQRRHGAVAGQEAFQAFLQQRPCTAIEGEEARLLLDTLGDVMSASPFGDPRVARRISGIDTRWIQGHEDAPYRLEIERINFRHNNDGRRLHVDVFFRDNPFGDGELFCTVLSAYCSNDANPSGVMASFHESVPFSDLHHVTWRPVALEPGGRLQVAAAISSQVKVGNLSALRPYA